MWLYKLVSNKMKNINGKENSWFYNLKIGMLIIMLKKSSDMEMLNKLFYEDIIIFCNILTEQFYQFFQ